MGLGRFKAGDSRGKLGDVKAVIPRIESNHTLIEKTADKTDGISIDFSGWRFNSGPSDTGPLARINIVFHAGAALVHVQARETLQLLARV
jgi:phosphomannomutase